jgi:hypothetical protein
MRGLRRFNPNDPRNWNDSSSPSYHHPANPNSAGAREARATRKATSERLSASDANPDATPGVLVPEAPIQNAREGGLGAPGPAHEVGPHGERTGEIRGTVLQVVQPRVNENPWLVLDIRTDSGSTVVVRGRFFWGAVRAPYVAQGHYVRVGGKPTRDGYIKPQYIVNESNGSRWRRSRLWPW